MAYVSQEHKKKIAALLKSVVPKDWKYSLSVRNHSTLVMTVKSAPVDIIAMANAELAKRAALQGESLMYTVEGNVEVNVYHYRSHWPESLVKILDPIIAVLNTGNWDRSDISTDYFDVGFYVSLRFGAWDKPYTCTAPKQEAAVA